MEKEFIYVAGTVDEAIKNGLTDLGLKEEDVKIEVLEGGSAGIFGLFKKEARVKLSPLDSEFKKEDKPKVIFADAVATSQSSILIGDLAKLIKQNGVDTGQKRLFEWMRENEFLIKQKGESYNMPTQKSMNLGLFEIKERTVLNPDGSIRISKTPKVTGKGQQYFINVFLNE